MSSLFMILAALAVSFAVGIMEPDLSLIRHMAATLLLVMAMLLVTIASRVLS